MVANAQVVFSLRSWPSKYNTFSFFTCHCHITFVCNLCLWIKTLCQWRDSQTSNAGFRLTCRLPHCRYAAWSSLAVSELQLSAATPLWLYHRAASLPSWIEFNCLRSAAVGKAARLSIYWFDAACRLVIPLRQVALAQLNKYHHQSGNAASGKLVWNQHNNITRHDRAEVHTSWWQVVYSKWLISHTTVIKNIFDIHKFGAIFLKQMRACLTSL